MRRRTVIVALCALAGGCDGVPDIPPPPRVDDVSEVEVPLPGDSQELTIDTPPPVSGRAVADATPADVLARVELLRADVEALRLLMGRREVEAPRLRVAEALPRAVYHEAENLLRSVHTLSYEVARSRGPDPDPLEGDPTPGDVFRLVDRAFIRVRLTLTALGETSTATERAAPPETTATESFAAVVAASAEIENLLFRQTRASDVFQEVTRAAHLAQAIASTIEGTRFPDEPPLESRLTPRDAYRELVRTYRAAEALADSAGHDLVELEVTEGDAALARLHDVHDLALLLVSELTHLHRVWPRAPTPPGAHDPGLKFPSHIHQRTRLVRAILEDATEQRP